MLARGQITVTNLDDGIGVKGVTGYYLASPLSEGIRKDTPGWTTEMQPLTPENKYLWNKEIVHYTDNESALKDKTEVLSGQEIFTDKADADAVVHVGIDGKSYQHAGSGKNLFRTKELKSLNATSWVVTAYVYNFKLKPNTKYTLSSNVPTNADSAQTVLYFNGSGTSPNGVYDGKSNTQTTDSEGNVFIAIPTGRTYTEPLRNGEYWVQLEEGSTATAYEPPAPTPDYPIEIHSLNNFDVASSVGRRNLLKNSGKEVSGTGYSLTVYDWFDKKDMVGGERYTVTVVGDLQNGHSGWYLNIVAKNSSGTTYHPALITLDNSHKVSEDTWVGSFTMPNVTEYVGQTILHSLPLSNGITATVKNISIVKGEYGGNYCPAPEDIAEDTNHPLIDKANILLSEPLRSVGNVKDRLFRDSDGLWKVERNVGEVTLKGTESWRLFQKNANTTAFTTYNATNPWMSNAVDFTTNVADKNVASSHFPIKNSTAPDENLLTMYSVGTNKWLWITLEDDIAKTLSEYTTWLGSNNIQVVYRIKPTIETLSQADQDKLNNIASYKDSNYLYTIVDKTNILPNYVSENLKPTLHATFKSKAWSGNNAGYPSVIGVYGDSAKMLYLSATAESMTFNADGTPNPSSQVITLTANLQNVSGNASFVATAYNGSTVVSNVVLSGVGNTRTFNQAQFPASANRVQVRVTLGNLVDTVTIVKLTNGSNGQNAVVGLLTNESITLPANKDGLVSNFTGATGVFDVYDGITKKTGSGVTYSLVSQSNITVSINATTGAYTVTAMPTGTTVLNGHAVLRAIYNGVTIEKQLNVSKSIAGATGSTGATGATGTSATSYWITASNNIIGKSQTGVINPTTITFNGFSKTGTANSVAYSGRFIIQTSTNGTTYATKYTSSADQNTYTYTIPANSLFVKCLFYMAGGTTVLLDEQTVPIVESAEGIQIGGENLITNSGNFKTLDGWNGSAVVEEKDGFNTIKVSGTLGSIERNLIPIKPSTEYIITAEIMTSVATPIYTGTPLHTYFYSNSSANGGLETIKLLSKETKTKPNEWTRIILLVKTKSVLVGDSYFKYHIYYPDYINTTTPAWLKNASLYEGNTVKPWSPSPQDARTYKAWANSADGTADFTRVYPNENLISKDVVIDKSYINATGAVVPLANTFTTEKIEVTSGVEYTLKNHSATAGKGIRIIEYNSSGTMTKYDNVFNGVGTVKLASTTTHVRVNVDTLDGTYSNDAKLERGTTPTIYTTNPSDSLTGSMPKYVGFSPLDSDKPSDYEWIINPEWTESSSMEYTSSQIEQTSKSIMTTVTESFVAEEDYTKYKTDISTQFEQTANTFGLNFKTISETVKTIDGKVDANFEEMSKYIRFEDGNIVLGSSGSNNTLRITQNEMAFMQGGVRVAYFSNQSFYINKGVLVESLEVGGHSLVKGSDGHTSFKYIG